MSMQRGLSAARASTFPTVVGMLGLLLVLPIIGLVVLLGWRDGGRATD